MCPSVSRASIICDKSSGDRPQSVPETVCVRACVRACVCACVCVFSRNVSMLACNSSPSSLVLSQSSMFFSAR